MLNIIVIAAGLFWLGLLFAAALWGERRPNWMARHWAIVYALSLAVYCTSWTFYGTVTQASRSGWPLPPTFIGTILLYVLGFGLLTRLVRLVRASNSTSIADFVATRLGKDSWLAAAVTLVAVLGIVPYIALQLKAVAMSYGLLIRASQLETPPWQDSALYVALIMAVFAMLFGTRSASAAEHNRGLMLAIALESLLKLAAMLVIGIWVVAGHGWIAGATPPRIDGTSGFPALILLGVLAMFTLPHQFHVSAVECRDERHLRTARWLFPLYMCVIALPMLPLARLGDALLGPAGVPSDLYVLALPLSEGHGGLALLAFLGGLSAATGMVIVATLSLSLMIGNHWVAPLLVRGPWSRRRTSGDLRGSVLRQRRMAILAVVLLAWIYSRASAGSEELADIGALSFSGLATLTPAVLFAMLRPQTPPRAVLYGLVIAVVVWFWALLVPTLAARAAIPPDWLLHGPFEIRWLAPDHLFGLEDWSRLARGVTLSLIAGTAATLWFAARTRATSEPVALDGLDLGMLRELATRFVPRERVIASLGETSAGAADAVQQAAIERELATVLGAASARLLLDAAGREHGRDLDTVATIVGEASQALRFNQRVLEAALENMSQGISVVDRELRLVAWNRRYSELFEYPEDLLRIGRPIADLARHALSRVAAGDIEAMLERRLAHMRVGTPHLSERRMPDGSLIEIRGNPMPGGGFVATFTDVTTFRRTEQELKQVAATLEQRVIARTAELARASDAAERANQARSRFLATVSHDLAQPLNAAHLFTHALMQRLDHEQYREAVANIDGALTSADDLLAGLLDISRLDAGGLVPNVQAFRADGLLRGLASEFGILASEKGVELHYVPTRAWLRSDPQLLRRVLQNFLANAVRYTLQGRIVLGCRRCGQHLRIEVWDSGPGIAEGDRALVFEEFRRLDRGGPGLGLGLAIAERTAQLLGHELTLKSWPGHGSVFAIDVPLAAAELASDEMAADAEQPAPRTRVLVVDNDASVLKAMQALLGDWNCDVLAADGASAAAVLCEREPPDLLLLDYHLDGGTTGLDLRENSVTLRTIPCIIITADHSEAVRLDVQGAGCHLLYKPLKPLALRSLMARLR